jgi:hypothetical protein
MRIAAIRQSFSTDAARAVLRVLADQITIDGNAEPAYRRIDLFRASQMLIRV